MRRVVYRPSWLVVFAVFVAACSSQRVVPESLEPLVDRGVTFPELLSAPESFQGRVVVLGGEVLKAKRLKNGTLIELLQLPLDKNERPSFDRQRSQGRFFAIQQEFLDPATLVEGTKLTIVGEVSGSKTEHLDDVEYRYPMVIVNHLHSWAEPSQDYGRPRPGLSLGIFGGTGGRIGGGGGFGIGF
jgi:outer membrane lipoprotein